METRSSTSKFKTLLVLARASNLPTVWSNCLAGWILGGKNDWLTFSLLCMGATFLYVGGMFLNDAFDAEFDRNFRKERPIPSGKISAAEVWILGAMWLVMGVTCLFWMGIATFGLSLLLVGCILFYDWIHKRTVLSPIPMAVCRFLLYLLAASAAAQGVRVEVIWPAAVLAAYVIGLSYIAKAESAPGPLRFWPIAFLVAPLLLTFAGQNEISTVTLSVSAVLALWIALALRHLFFTRQKNIGASVSALLAGIVLVDLLAVRAQKPEFIVAFACLFLAARLFQKFIPAT